MATEADKSKAAQKTSESDQPGSLPNDPNPDSSALNDPDNPNQFNAINPNPAAGGDYESGESDNTVIVANTEGQEIEVPTGIDGKNPVTPNNPPRRAVSD